MLGGIFGQGALLIPVFCLIMAWCIFRGPDLIKRNNRVAVGSFIILVATSLFFARHAGHPTFADGLTPSGLVEAWLAFCWAPHCACERRYCVR